GSPQTYCYAISALDSIGLESARSAAVTATPKDYAPPAPPQGISAVGDCAVAGTIDVSWLPNASTDDVRHYWLYRNSDPRIDLGQNTSYTDTATTPGTAYYYSVVAEDGNGNQSVSSLRAGVTAKSGTVPVPGPPSAQGGNGQVSLRVSV